MAHSPLRPPLQFRLHHLEQNLHYARVRFSRRVLNKLHAAALRMTACGDRSGRMCEGGQDHKSDQAVAKAPRERASSLMSVALPFDRTISASLKHPPRASIADCKSVGRGHG